MATQRKSSSLIALGLIAVVSVLASQVDASFPYYGTKIGALKRLHHGVSGDVYAVDSRTLFVKNFNYDGEAPAAYFYVGNTNKPSNEGALRVRDERGGSASLTRRYRNKDITLSLPEGKTLRDIKWFSVWCDEFAVNFGDVSIPNNLDFPRPQKITALKGVHGVGSENIVIVDAQTLLVPNFSYDGEAPDAKFWVGRGQHPSPQGLRIPDENGKEDPLRRYDKKTIVLTLPGDLTIFDIGHFGVWCEAFTVDFGHVTIPEGLNVPPSLKMLGISPQSKLNCEVLYDDLAFEVRWAVAGESIVVQLVAKLAKNEYMSFGISPDRDHSVMIGSDVVVAWVDQATGKGYAHDYYLEDKSQCSGRRGTCPDVNIQDNTNSIRLLNAAMVNGYSIVTYQRSLQATDKLDLPIAVNGTFEAIVWAIGPLNERKEASFHSQYLKRTHYIDFGRQPTWNCPMPEDKSAAQTDDSDDSEEDDENQTGYPPAKSKEPEEEYYDNRQQALKRPSTTSERSRPVPTPKPVTSNDGAWDIPAIQCHEPEDGVFYAQMGPTGGKHGYPAITGHVGWGISWYINGLLIPEIHVVRGKTYTFVVEGGNNPDIPAKYHPFYITDDPVGGYEHKRDEEKKAVRIFAGVHRSRSNQITPTGVGRLCNWTPDVDGPPADDYHSFGAYQRTLTLQCDNGEPGVITWKPDKNTPDTVYYHCFTHRYLGWKIHVHDSCDADRYAASDRHEVRVRPSAVDDYAAESSARHETKVSPNDNFLLKHQSDLIKNHNMNGTPPKLTFEITKSSEITKLISDGIRAAEALEESIVRNSTPLSTTSNSIHAHTPHHHHSNSKVRPKGPSLPASEVSSNSKPQATVAELMLAAQQPQNPAAASAGAGLIGETNIPQHPLQHPLPPNQLHAHTHSNAHAHAHPSPPSNTVIAHANHSPPPPPPPSTPVIHLKAQSHLHKHPLLNLTNQKTIGLSDYLRPPQNAPLFKLPGRRPYPVFVKAKLPPPKVVLPQQLPRHPAAGLPAGPLPQPSLIVNHYRRPVAMPALLKPFRYEKPFPMPAAMGAAPVLMLGQPTMLVHPQKMDSHLYAKPKPIIPVPYGDLMPQASLASSKYAAERKPEPAVKGTKPNVGPDKKPVAVAPVTPAAVFKMPFDVHQVKEEPSSLDVASLQPAVNHGFKPDSVVVESGFRPIIRDGIKLPEDQVAHRREDTASEIDEAMETDTLFLTAQQGPQNFEPMFIPSPPDSVNDTIIVRKVAASPPQLLTANTTEQQGPVTAELRNATREEEPKPNRMDAYYDGPVEKVSATVDNSEKEFLEGDNYGNTIERFMDKLKMELQIDDEFDHEEEDDDPVDDNEDGGDYDDRVAAAAERIDTYYLPPDNRKVPNAHVPVGTAFTYDGKAVVDSSLVVPPKLDGSSDAHAQRHGPGGLSNLEQFIRTTPQFQPFRGEIPPQVAEYLSTEAPPPPSLGPLLSTDSPSSLGPLNLYSSSSQTSPSPSSLASPRPISTKLQIVKKSA